MGRWEKQWIVIPNTTMKQFKWMPASQESKVVKTKANKSEPKQRRLFTENEDNLAMDEDSNMSNASTASDSMDGQLTSKPEEDSSHVGEVKRMTIVTAEGGRYTGESTIDGKREGQGEYIWPNNDRYVGAFVDGVKNGNGILYFSNGDKRVGVWKDDKLHGPASYYYAGGVGVDIEVWEEDHKVSEQRRKLSPF